MMTTLIAAYIEAIDFLTQSPTPQRMAAFRFSADVEAGVSALLDKNRDGQLSAAEEVELEQLGRLEERLQLLKAKAIIEIRNRSYAS